VQAAGIELRIDLEAPVPDAFGDERRIKQVLVNLLTNAAKFTPSGGTITVTVRRITDALEVAVSDTGIGIAEEDQSSVFEDFRQVGSADLAREGSGLGLALARRLLELHGGTIWVESEVGRGSTFTFRLPDAPVAVGAKEPAQA
jgi:signal transduction histidine kinase